MCTNEKEQELILKYIQDKLTVEEKKELFRLTLAKPSFRQELKEELELAGKIQESSIELDSKTKNRIYENIRLKAAKKNLSEKKVESMILEWLFNISIPEIALPVFKFIKRR